MGNTSKRPSAHTLISDSTHCGRSRRILGRVIEGGGAWKVHAEKRTTLASAVANTVGLVMIGEMSAAPARVERNRYEESD